MRGIRRYNLIQIMNIHLISLRYGHLLTFLFKTRRKYSQVALTVKLCDNIASDKPLS